MTWYNTLSEDPVEFKKYMDEFKKKYPEYFREKK